MVGPELSERVPQPQRPTSHTVHISTAGTPRHRGQALCLLVSASCYGEPAVTRECALALTAHGTFPRVVSSPFLAGGPRLDQTSPLSQAGL